MALEDQTNNTSDEQGLEEVKNDSWSNDGRERWEYGPGQELSRPKDKAFNEITLNKASSSSTSTMNPGASSQRKAHIILNEVTSSEETSSSPSSEGTSSMTAIGNMKERNVLAVGDNDHSKIPNSFMASHQYETCSQSSRADPSSIQTSNPDYQSSSENGGSRRVGLERNSFVAGIAFIWNALMVIPLDRWWIILMGAREEARVNGRFSYWTFAIYVLLGVAATLLNGYAGMTMDDWLRYLKMLMTLGEFLFVLLCFYLRL